MCIFSRNEFQGDCYIQIHMASMADSSIQDIQDLLHSLTLSSFLSSDTGFKFNVIIVCMIFMAWYMIKQNQKANKFEKILNRYQKLGVDVPDGIKQNISHLSGLGISAMGYWITASAGAGMLIIMFLM